MIKKVKASYVKESSENFKIDQPQLCVDFWKKHIETQECFDEDKEIVVVLCLDSQSNVKHFNIVSIGTVNESMAHPRDIFKPAILVSAVQIILMHNHPSGGLDPSRADHAITKKVKEAGTLLQIPLCDHVIVGNGYYSFRESGHV